MADAAELYKGEPFALPPDDFPLRSNARRKSGRANSNRAGDREPFSDYREPFSDFWAVSGQYDPIPRASFVCQMLP